MNTGKLTAREISKLVAENIIAEMDFSLNILRNKLNNNELINLSMDYESAEREAHIKYEQIMKALPADLQKQLISLMEARKDMEIAGNTLCYKRGLSNGIKMLLHHTII